MKLKDLHNGNSAAPVILLYFLCGRRGNHQTIRWFHAHWSFTLELTIQEDDKNYLITGLKITAVATQAMDDYNCVWWLHN